MQGQTWTEIEIYDTEKPADPETGEHPVKARVKQRSEQRGAMTATEQSATEAKSTSDSEETQAATTLDEVTVTATKSPSLWERTKQGVAWAGAILILAAAGWIIYKLRKTKTT